MALRPTDGTYISQYIDAGRLEFHGSDGFVQLIGSDDLIRTGALADIVDERPPRLYATLRTRTRTCTICQKV